MMTKIGLTKKNEKIILNFIKNLNHKKNIRKVAVFDADGTLWRDDLGESFFQYQIQKKILPKEYWFKYHNEVASGDKLKAYQWLGKWLAGQSLDTHLKQCREFLIKTKFLEKNIFKPMQNLIQFLHENDFECWVITASPKWIVQEALKFYEVPQHRVIGIENYVTKKGVLKKNLKKPIPYAEGKAKALKLYIKSKPYLAAGNTIWDKNFMDLSVGLKMAIFSAKKNEANFFSEQKLKSLAKQKKWLIQKF
jgi:phosphoserine phosphatase